jgi:hypothetical protein
MIIPRSKWWMSALFLLCLTPMSFANLGHGEHRRRERVPDGGSSIVYLLGAGMTCLGAMFVRSRMAKPTQS